MRLLNFSRVSTKKINKIAKFVFKHFPKEVLDLTEIHILDDCSYSPSTITGSMYAEAIIPRESYKLRSGVYCNKKSYLGTLISPKTTYFIVINIGTNRHYPHQHPYKIRAGIPEFKNFKEDLIHVLGHELFHCVQASIGYKGSKYYEVEAEEKANEILAALRKK
jgi:hypothetical protein